MKILQIIERILFGAGGLIFISGLICFVKVNFKIVKNKALLLGGWGSAVLCMTIGFVLFFITEVQGTGMLIAKVALLCFAVILFIGILRNSLLKDFFQPLSLSSITCVFLISGVMTIFVTSVLGLLLRTNGVLSLLMPMFVIIIMLTSVVWAQTQGWSKFENIKNKPLFLFKNGEGGYKTFRIPSLIVLEREVLNKKYGYSFQHDILLASAEARRNTSYDYGDIDMVGKLSSDGGKSWTELLVLFEVENEIGKVGNPTPVFDKVNGVLNFVCTFGKKQEKFSLSTYNIQGVMNADLTITWKEKIAMDKFVPGPGKSIQLKSGRLVVPGDGHAQYSDDYGLTWKTGEKARGGESEVLELSNGELMMVTRFGVGCSKYHREQYQKISYSKDNGESWYMNRDITLKTPMCQSSLDKTSDGTLYFSHPDYFLTRANLSVGISDNNGETWSLKRLYNGPSGYSCVSVDSSDTVYVLAEVGKVNYNDALVFLSVDCQ